MYCITCIPYFLCLYNLTSILVLETPQIVKSMWNKVLLEQVVRPLSRLNLKVLKENEACKNAIFSRTNLLACCSWVTSTEKVSSLHCSYQTPCNILGYHHWKLRFWDLIHLKSRAKLPLVDLITRTFVVLAETANHELGCGRCEVIPCFHHPGGDYNRL